MLDKVNTIVVHNVSRVDEIFIVSHISEVILEVNLKLMSILCIKDSTSMHFPLHATFRFLYSIWSYMFEHVYFKIVNAIHCNHHFLKHVM